MIFVSYAAVVFAVASVQQPAAGSHTGAPIASRPQQFSVR